jgi:MraZ protein
MFIGEYNHNLDAKGRVAIPVKFRAALKGGAVVTRGVEKHLTLYSADKWNAIASPISELPVTNQSVRAYTRLMLAGAMAVDIDRSGRIVIPQYLRKFANLSGSVILAGLYNRIEIWNEKDWQAYSKKTESEAVSIANELTDLGV